MQEEKTNSKEILRNGEALRNKEGPERRGSAVGGGQVKLIILK